MQKIVYKFMNLCSFRVDASPPGAEPQITSDFAFPCQIISASN